VTLTRNLEQEPEHEPHDWVLQAIATDQLMGNALAAAIGGPGDAHAFDDANALRLVGANGRPAWAVETVTRGSRAQAAAQYAQGVNPSALNLSAGQFAAARAVVTVRAEGRGIQYTLVEWARSLGFEVAQ
jgi:hypothetical protein